MKHKLFTTFLSLCFSVLLFAQSKKLSVATNWLENNKQSLNIQEHHELDMLFSRVGLSGETFRFYQKMNDVKVFNAEVTIHVSNKNEVTFITSTYDASIKSISTIPSILESQALQIALSKLNVRSQNIVNATNALFLLNKNNITRLVRRITIQSYTKIGVWEVIVDAVSGAVLSSNDIAKYQHGDKHKKKKKQEETLRATGTAMVFETDPLGPTNSVYGGQFVDANDATNQALNNARTAVTLLDIQFSGGNYRLKGPYVEIAELSEPNKGLFIQNSNNFQFNRAQDGFEAANAYYHIDKSLRYINTDLGISLQSSQNNGVVRYDAHGVSGSDNSFYSEGALHFGEGCIDDAEDADVILHELGHGLEDWLTNGSASDAIGEGNGDYWANSYKRSIGEWSENDAARNWIFGWDGHNVCWEGRSTNFNGTFPGSLTGSIHKDGQIWASALMEVYDVIGKQKTDKAFLEGIARTNSGSNQRDAAIAVRQAAIDMGENHGYLEADIKVFTDVFTARGYLGEQEPIIQPDPISIFPNPTNGMITLKNINKQYNVLIFNVLGQLIKQKIIDTTTNTINVSSLNSGAYFITFEQDNTVLKFIKQ